MSINFQSSKKQQQFISNFINANINSDKLLYQNTPAIDVIINTELLFVFVIKR